MTFIEKHKFFITFIFGAIILMVTFYWFEYRPIRIRIKCLNSAKQLELGFIDPASHSSLTQEEILLKKKEFHQDCLTYEGLAD
ncbi:MAG: hypothetical protein AAB968_05290 [Patescibacteria group bacterium]